MALARALVAFLETLADPGTDQGPAQDNARAAAPAAPESLGQILEAHAVRIAQLEASLEAIKTIVREESARAERAAERGRRAVQRAVARLEGSEELELANEELQGLDAGISAGAGMHPVRAHVANSGRDEAPQMTEEQQRLAYIEEMRTRIAVL